MCTGLNVELHPVDISMPSPSASQFHSDMQQLISAGVCVCVCVGGGQTAVAGITRHCHLVELRLSLAGGVAPHLSSWHPSSSLIASLRQAVSPRISSWHPSSSLIASLRHIVAHHHHSSWHQSLSPVASHRQAFVAPHHSSWHQSLSPSSPYTSSYVPPTYPVSRAHHLPCVTSTSTTALSTSRVYAYRAVPHACAPVLHRICTAPHMYRTAPVPHRTCTAPLLPRRHRGDAREAPARGSAALRGARAALAGRRVPVGRLLGHGPAHTHRGRDVRRDG